MVTCYTLINSSGRVACLDYWMRENALYIEKVGGGGEAGDLLWGPERGPQEIDLKKLPNSKSKNRGLQRRGKGKFTDLLGWIYRHVPVFLTGPRIYLWWSYCFSAQEDRAGYASTTSAPREFEDRLSADIHTEVMSPPTRSGELGDYRELEKNGEKGGTTAAGRGLRSGGQFRRLLRLSVWVCRSRCFMRALAAGVWRRSG